MTSPMGFHSICRSFDTKPHYLDETFSLFIYGLTTKGEIYSNFSHAKSTKKNQRNLFFNFPIEIGIGVMKFITKLLIVSQADYEFRTFADQLNALTITTNMKETIRGFFYNSNIISQTLVNCLENAEDAESSDVDANIILYEQLIDLFEKHSKDAMTRTLQTDSQPKHSNFEYLCPLLAALFKWSDRFRALGTADNFILTIVEQMERIHGCVDGSFTDFIRRNGIGKAEKFIGQLKLLMNMILSWYSCDCLQDDDCINALVCICQKFWPSIGVSAELQFVFMRMLLFISNDSLPGKCWMPEFFFFGTHLTFER